MEDLSPSRPLGPGEKIIWLLDRVCRFSFITHAELEGELPAAALRAGLDAAQARHPLLRARIVRAGHAGARFVRDCGGPLPFRELALPDDDWSAIAEDELAGPFPTDGPLARAALVRLGSARSVVLLTLHHAIGDGMAGLFLTRDVLHAAAKAMAGDEPALPPLPLPRAMEDGFPAFARGLAGARANAAFTLDLMKSRLRLGLPARPRPDGCAPPGERRVHLERRVIEPEQLQLLADRCREHHATVHGALAAALILAISRDLGLDRARPFLLGSDVDLRSRLVPPVGDDMGFFISGGITWHRAGPERGFWDLAAEVSSSLHAAIDRGQPFTGLPKTLALLAAVLAPLGAGDLASRVTAAYFDRTNLGILGLSNLGRIDLDLPPALSLRSLGFASSFSTASSLCLHALTLNNRLSLGLTTMTPIIAPDHARRIADLIAAVLTEQAAP